MSNMRVNHEIYFDTYFANQESNDDTFFDFLSTKTHTSFYRFYKVEHFAHYIFSIFEINQITSIKRFVFDNLAKHAINKVEFYNFATNDDSFKLVIALRNMQKSQLNIKISENLLVENEFKKNKRQFIQSKTLRL